MKKPQKSIFVPESSVFVILKFRCDSIIFLFQCQREKLLIKANYYLKNCNLQFTFYYQKLSID